MEQTFTTSKTISAFDYTEHTKELIITFTTGKKYSYRDVPVEVVMGALKAESVGSYVNQNIKGHYEYRLIN